MKHLIYSKLKPGFPVADATRKKVILFSEWHPDYNDGSLIKRGSCVQIDQNDELTVK